MSNKYIGEITKAQAKKCITHHWGCDCREYRYKEMERALKLIHTWASVPQALSPEHVRKLCAKVIKNEL